MVAVEAAASHEGDRQTDEQTDTRHHRRKPPVLRRELYNTEAYMHPVL